MAQAASAQTGNRRRIDHGLHPLRQWRDTGFHEHPLLSMVVGNPSARCFANAPWRAFCWMCAYLAEFNRDPWGVIKDAVQTSLELSEPVDIQRLLDYTNSGRNTTSTLKVMLPTLCILCGSTHKQESCSIDTPRSKKGGTSQSASKSLSLWTTLMNSWTRLPGKN